MYLLIENQTPEGLTAAVQAAIAANGGGPLGPPIFNPARNVYAQAVADRSAGTTGSSAAIVNDGDSAPVFAGASATGVIGTAEVSQGFWQSTSIPSTDAIVANGSTTNIESATGSGLTTATCVTQTGTLQGVKLPANVAVVGDTQVVSGVTVTGTGTTATFTVSNNEITAIHLTT